MMPQSFLMLPSTTTLHVNPETGHKYRRNKQFFLYEYGSLDLDQLYTKMKLILDVNEMRSSSANKPFHLYLAIPSSLSEDLNDVFYHKSSAALIKRTVVKTFFPHLSTEAMPKLFSQHLCHIQTDLEDIDQTCGVYDMDDIENPYSVSRVIREFSAIMHQFGLILYRIELRKKIK
jgi:phosphatidylinositol glycan class Z